ncbi:hypothetical protein KVH24_30420 [Streptomyces olivaceus]|uniref:hypothetical protein n=1 Tax=Streptomyces olivaceus TaxID=47716 RepID=UPI001CCD87BF|nr:hypothetical protein [Streptomyces olivaceus]MBZ6176898.1 hypothetical protein [Streptomyces olivaceus]MBZ6183279.1 hypothetical protein [Streptomyces olivaceus]
MWPGSYSARSTPASAGRPLPDPEGRLTGRRPRGSPPAQQRRPLAYAAQSAAAAGFSAGRRQRVAHLQDERAPDASTRTRTRTRAGTVPGRLSSGPATSAPTRVPEARAD